MNTIYAPVAGLQFYDLADLRDALVQGIRLRPQRDPENPKDANAVSLWLDRGEAERWEIVGLIANDDGERKRWMVGHLPREVARRFAPHIDAGLGLDVFVHGGDRDGAWSLDVRLEGPAADAVRAAEAVEAAEADRRRDVSYAASACVELDRMFPGHGWIEAAEVIDPERGWNWIGVRRRQQGRPYGIQLPQEEQERRIENLNRGRHLHYQTRQKDLEKAFGADIVQRVRGLMADVAKATGRNEKLARRLRASVKRKDLTDADAIAAVEAADAIEAALAALARIGG